MTSTKSVSTGQVVLVALIWAVIAVINIAYARRHPAGPELHHHATTGLSELAGRPTTRGLPVPPLFRESVEGHRN